MIIVFIEEPERGAAERQKGEIANAVVATSYWDDIKALVTKYWFFLHSFLSKKCMHVFEYFKPNLRLWDRWIHRHRIYGWNIIVVGANNHRALRSPQIGFE